MSALAESSAALSRDEARSLTDEVKSDAERLWRKLVELYEGGAHTALGYSSWGAYFKTEFGGSREKAYKILDAGRVARELDECTNGTTTFPKNERVARELAPLKNDPDALREAWAEVVEQHPEPTAADVRGVVRERVGVMSRKATMNAEAAKRRVYTALSGIDGYRTALADFPLERALAVAAPEDTSAWLGLINEALAGLNRLKREIQGGTR